MALSDAFQLDERWVLWQRRLPVSSQILVAIVAVKCDFGHGRRIPLPDFEGSHFGYSTARHRTGPGSEAVAISLNISEGGTHRRVAGIAEPGNENYTVAAGFPFAVLCAFA